MKKFLFLGGLFGFLGVAFGAFGAHALEKRLQALGTVETYKTGVHYHLIYAVVLVLIALLADRIRDGKAQKRVDLSGNLIAAGILVFSGSLYVYAVTKVTAWALITPLGGLCFLAGWALLAFSATKEL